MVPNEEASVCVSVRAKRSVMPPVRRCMAFVLHMHLVATFELLHSASGHTHISRTPSEPVCETRKLGIILQLYQKGFMSLHESLVVLPVARADVTSSCTGAAICECAVLVDAVGA